MHKITWSDEMSTGVDMLDNLHRDLFEKMSYAASTTNDKFADYYSLLVKEVDCAFIKEECWMEKIDSDLLKVYREQHAGVLSALHNVHRKVLNGEFDLGRKVVEDLLPKWYVVHISTLDMVLAIAMQEKEIQIPAASQPSEIYII